MRITSLLLAAGAVGLFAAGCGSSSSSSSKTTASKTVAAASSGAVDIASRSVPGVGVVLVDGRGRTLYIYTPDNAKQVTCTGGCASTWPPVTLPGSAHAAAAGAVSASLLGSDANAGGGHVVTYKGWPLYNYVADPTPGTASGEGSGGVWYVISPTGTVVKKAS
jgi:predicted lipoprotein with Yx(FWY)xxD motif